MTQKWNSEKYTQDASFVSTLGMPVIELLSPKMDEKILDLGCGDGTLANKLTLFGCDVTGIDFSESMVNSARNKGVNAFCLSGEKLAFNQQFDAVFSNAALHWMTDYNAVLKGVHSSLTSNGRFVGEFGGFGNIASITKAIESVYQETPELGVYQSPWFFPSVNEYKNALEKQRFIVDYIKLIDRPTPLKSGIIEWLEIFADHAMSSMKDESKHYFLKNVEQLVKPHLYTKEKGWVADYVRLRFSARKLI